MLQRLSFVPNYSDFVRFRSNIEASLDDIKVSKLTEKDGSISKIICSVGIDKNIFENALKLKIANDRKHYKKYHPAEARIVISRCSRGKLVDPNVPILGLSNSLAGPIVTVRSTDLKYLSSSCVKITYFCVPKDIIRRFPEVTFNEADWDNVYKPKNRKIILAIIAIVNVRWTISGSKQGEQEPTYSNKKKSWMLM